MLLCHRNFAALLVRINSSILMVGAVGCSSHISMGADLGIDVAIRSRADRGKSGRALTEALER